MAICRCSVWTESDAWVAGCQSLNYPSAAAFCASVSVGSRLCTAAEIDSGCARGTGCGADADLVWTSSTNHSANYPPSASVCPPASISTVVSQYVTGRDTTGQCATVFTLAQTGNSTWDYLSNCHCFLLIPRATAANLTCLPSAAADQSLASVWAQCSTIGGNGVVQANPNRYHQIVCGNGNPVSCANTYGRGNGAARSASDSSYHEVRCCSDVAVVNWTRRSGCSVWTESDAWVGGCQVLNWPTAAAFCHHQGGRLCTTTELDSGCARGTGCNHDSDLIWAASTTQTIVGSDFGPRCAGEHQQCTCTGSVIYGVSQTWTPPRTVNGSISCNNNVFGDPLRSVVKECRCQSSLVPTCSSAELISTVTPFLSRNATCLANAMAAAAGNSSWDALSNCQCYLLVPQSNASQFTCLPTATASQTLYQDWLQCQALSFGHQNLTAGGSHVVECGGGVSSRCVNNGYPASGYNASNSELHEVRCCSDTQIHGWRRNAGCSVWTESDAWSQGCSILNYPDAAALCRSQGGRLCTASEVTSRCARGTGCGHDADFVWTNSQVCSVADLTSITTR